MGRIGVGVDWGAQEHEVCAIDEQYRQLKRWRVRHDGESLARLCRELAALVGANDEVLIAIERPDGAVVETLMERGFAMHAINPMQLDRFRERYRPSGAKDDSVDAWVLARTVLSDTDCFRRVRMGDARHVALREWSRIREQWVCERTRLLNRMTDVLRRYFPQILDVGRVDESWVHELLRKAPTPEQAQRIQQRTVAKVLQEHSIRRVKADAVVVALRVQPLTLHPPLVAVLAAHVLQLVEQIESNATQIKRCNTAIAEVLNALETSESVHGKPSDAKILRSLPGVGTNVLATLLGEATTAVEARDLPRMRALTGCAPVSILSGKRQNRFHPRSSPNVQMRYACSDRLSSAMYHCARAASVCSEPHKKRYAAMRARGHTHGRACRQLADQMLTTAFAMLRNRTLYDASKSTSKTLDQR
jgi:transposase